MAPPDDTRDGFQRIEGPPAGSGTGELAGERERPVYWLGERPNPLLELTETAEGNIFIRYLPPEAEIGDPTPGFLTVGTYPVGDGYAATQGAAEADGAITDSAPGDAI